MAIRIIINACIVAAFGAISFKFGIVAENKKPSSGNPQTSVGGDSIICNYPADPTIVLGFLSVGSLAVSVLVGHFSVFYPYKGKYVPRYVFFRSTSFLVFFLITWAISMLGVGMMSWVTIAELRHLTNNVHKDMNTTCPTAKPGLFGGAAFIALSAALFWLICLMLVDDVRTYYFEDQEDSRAQVLTIDNDAKQQGDV